MTDFVADCVTDFCIFLSYKSVGKSFGVTYALLCIGLFSTIIQTFAVMSAVEHRQ